MKAIIKPQLYYSNEALNNENLQIFTRCWHYVGNIEDFKSVNDFVVIKIAGVPVVVQNLKGTLRAFKNICSHRHSLIQTQNSGNRPLMCPYHGWSYNESGYPFGIPKKPYFNFSAEDLECLKLKEYKLEVCGSLIFINLSETSESLIDYLGEELFDDLQKISNSFGEKVDYNEMEIKANWKILVENTLESYHVNLIHTNTFLRLGANGLDFNFFGKHSVWNATLKSSELEGKQEKIHRPFQNRKYRIDGYKHILIFPNLLISTTYGVSFNVSLIQPSSESSSIFKSSVYLTKVVGGEMEKSVITNLYKQSLIKFNRDVFDEDKEICEKVQLGVLNSHYLGELSDEEERVCRFQNAYCELVEIN